MRPVLFNLPLPLLGTFSIPSYGFMIMLGFLGGLWLALRRAKREKVNPDVIWDMWVYCLVAGIVGARLLYIIEHPGDFAGRFWDVFKIWEGGLSFYGGFIAAAVVNLVILRIRRVPVFKMYDLVAPSLILGLACGKVGCFLNGCCFGRESHVPWAVSFPAGTPIDAKGTIRPSPAFERQFLRQYTDEIARTGDTFSREDFLRRLNQVALTTRCTDPVHPVQLYEAGASLTILGALLVFTRYRRRYGETTCLFGTLYPAARFGLEFFRDRHAVLLGLTSAHLLSSGAFLVFGVLFIVVRKHGRKVAPPSPRETVAASGKARK